MKQVPTRRFRAKDGTILNAAIMEDEKLITVLARRDLVFLQRVFAGLESPHSKRYLNFKNRITLALDTLSPGVESHAHDHQS